MFRHPPSLRFWAVRVLLLWLIGIGASLAQACLATDHLAAPAAAAAAALGHEDHGGEAPGHPVPSATANCQDICDAATLTVAPQKPATVGAGLLALPPRLAASVLHLPALRSTLVWRPRREAPLAGLVPITLLRLAL